MYNGFQTFEALQPFYSCLFLTIVQVLSQAHSNLARSSPCVTQWFNLFCPPTGPDISTPSNWPVRATAKDFRVVCACRPFPPRRFQARPHSNQSRTVRKRPLLSVPALQTMPIVQAQVAWAFPFHCTATSSG